MKHETWLQEDGDNNSLQKLFLALKIYTGPLPDSEHSPKKGLSRDKVRAVHQNFILGSL